MPRAPIAPDKRKTAESLLGEGKSVTEVAKTVGIGVATASKIKAELPTNDVHLAHIAPQLRPLARPIGELHNDPANARKHPDRNIDAIKASLARFGQKKPLVARPVNGKLIVVAGNGTLDSAKALGWTHMAVSVQDMTDAEATAYAIADNRTAELAEWDDDTLAKLLGGLEPDMQAVAGFDETEIAAITANPDFSPIGEDQVASLDEKTPKICTCPKCGHEWTA